MKSAASCWVARSLWSLKRPKTSTLLLRREARSVSDNQWVMYLTRLSNPKCKITPDSARRNTVDQLSSFTSPLISMFITYDLSTSDECSPFYLAVTRFYRYSCALISRCYHPRDEGASFAWVPISDVPTQSGRPTFSMGAIQIRVL